jgi:hypothetical protein
VIDDPDYILEDRLIPKEGIYIDKVKQKRDDLDAKLLETQIKANVEMGINK